MRYVKYNFLRAEQGRILTGWILLSVITPDLACLGFGRPAPMVSITRNGTVLPSPARAGGRTEGRAGFHRGR